MPRPPLALTALELPRFGVEYPSSVVLDLVLPAPTLADGRPVLVLPGFNATDALTGRLRKHLRRRGWRPHGWGLTRNHGLTDAVVAGLPERLETLHRRYDGQRLDVVGWSFGGLLARWLAHEHPDLVRRVVCLGSPWRAEGEITRTTAMFERAAAKHGVSERARDIVDGLREPLPVPCTAVFSKTDGVVNWRSCALDGPGTENIAVPSSHVGLVSNPVALAVVTDRLAQDPAEPEPFDWTRCLTRTLLGARAA